MVITLVISFASMKREVIMNHYFNIKINDRIDGEDRFEMYEDPIDIYLTNNELGEVLNTGTMINDEGEIEYFDIEISLNHNDELTIERLIIFLESLNPPKGCLLTALSDDDDLDRDDTHAYSDEIDLENDNEDEDDNAIEFEYRDDLENSENTVSIEFGIYEGLGLYLDRVNLPDSLFEEYDIHEFIADVEIALDIDERGENDDLPLRCFELNDYTVLYFYGKSFHDMKKALAALIAEHPLCKGAKVVRVA